MPEPLWLCPDPNQTNLLCFLFPKIHCCSQDARQMFPHNQYLLDAKTSQNCTTSGCDTLNRYNLCRLRQHYYLDSLYQSLVLLDRFGFDQHIQHMCYLQKYQFQANRPLLLLTIQLLESTSSFIFIYILIIDKGYEPVNIIIYIIFINCWCGNESKSAKFTTCCKLFSDQIP